MYVVIGVFATQGRKKRAYYIRHACLFVLMNNSTAEKTLMKFYINPSDAAHELSRVIATGSSRLGSTWCLKKSEVNIYSHCQQERKINISDFSTMKFICYRGNR